MKATLIHEEKVTYKGGKYTALVKVYEVKKDEKFPYGIKAKFVLIDAEKGVERLLIDNHEPFGFHTHSKLPDQKKHRERMETTDYREALKLFFSEVRRIISEDKNA